MLFNFMQHTSNCVIAKKKIHFMQCKVHVCGPNALHQLMLSPHPVILPLLLYEHVFDVNIFVLL